MKIKKKAIALAVCTLCAASALATPAFAAEVSQSASTAVASASTEKVSGLTISTRAQRARNVLLEDDQNHQIVTYADWTYVFSISASIGPVGSNRLCCEGQVTTNPSYPVDITVILQKQSSSGSWSTHKSVKNSYSGERYYFVGEEWSIPQDGSLYRCAIKVQVKNSSGKIIETATGYCPPYVY